MKNNIRVITITEETAEAFAGLIEPQFFYPLNRPGHYCLGAVLEKEDQNYAAGILVFDVENGHIGTVQIPAVLLRWIYVAEEYRQQGIANQLMEECYRVLNAAGLDGLLCDVPFSEEYNLLCAFLEDWGFTFELRDQYDFLEPLGAIGSSPAFSGKKPGGVAKPVRDLSAEEWKQLISNMKKLERRAMLPEARDAYDADISCAVSKGQQIKGAFLVSMDAGGRLVPMALESLDSCSRPEIYDMLLYAHDAAEKKYGKNTLVCKECYSKELADLIGYMMPDAQPVLVRHGVYTGDGSVK